MNQVNLNDITKACADICTCPDDDIQTRRNVLNKELEKYLLTAKLNNNETIELIKLLFSSIYLKQYNINNYFNISINN